MENTYREYQIQMPVGYSDEHGAVHKDVVIRKMSGHEEALLYDPALSAANLVTELIRCCLIRIEGVDNINSDFINQLYIADRNYILMEIRRITLGNKMEAHYPCPRCGSDVSVIEDLSQIEITQISDDEFIDEFEVHLEDGYIDKSGTQHKELILSLPRGTDEIFVAPMMEKDPIKAQDALLLRCIKQFGTLSNQVLEAYGVKILRDLTMGDRQRLHTMLSKDMPGLQLERPLQCPACELRFSGTMDMSNFFVLG